MVFSRLPVLQSLPVMLFFGIALFVDTDQLHAQVQPGTQQVPAQAGQAPRLPRPAAQSMPVAIDPELKLILQNWERAGDFTKKLEGKHYRYIFDDVFSVQKISQGQFYYEAPDKGRIDLEVPKGIKEGEQIVRNGKKYTIKKDNGECWVCDGTQVLVIDKARKEFQRLPIPKESRGTNIVDGPFPFLFGISMEKIQIRYNVTLYRKEQGGQHDLQAGRIHLKVKPLWQQDAANWQEAEVMLNANYLPTAIRLIHPGGNSETVYVFLDVVRNPKKSIISSLWGENPFAPSLRSYKELKAIAQKPPAGNPLRKK